MSFDEIQTSTSSISYTEWNAMVKEIRHNDKSNCSVYIDGNETYVGNGAGASITTGAGNTLIGTNSGTGITATDNNTAIGYYSLDAVCTGANNVAVGVGSLGANTSGTENAAVGKDSMLLLTTGTENTAVEYGSLDTITTGDKNVAIGNNALGGATGTDIDNSVAIGYKAGYDNTADGVVLIGYQAGYSNTTANTLYINNSSSAYPLIYGNFATDTLSFGDNDASWNIQFVQARMHMKETTTPTPIDSYGALYTKSDGKLYFQSGSGGEYSVSTA